MNAPVAVDTLPGQTLGEYVIEAPIAMGGMGVVYRAVHPIIGRRVAVKVLRPEMAGDPEQVSRFLKEAQAISSIKHRGIIDIIGFGNLPDGRQYMVMEFLEGESLDAVLQRERKLPIALALPWADEVLDALSAAHKVGVVHRDLKPSNVFIATQSNGAKYLKLLDFGLAKQNPVLSDLMAAGIRTDKASLMAGTPEYIAPEQARGLVATPKTDLYGVGVMLFEMLTGELPFKGNNHVQLMQQHISVVAPRISSLMLDIPPSIDDLVAQLLEKEPGRRPASAEDVRMSIRRILQEIRQASTQPFIPVLNAESDSVPGGPPHKSISEQWLDDAEPKAVSIQVKAQNWVWFIAIGALVLAGGAFVALYFSFRHVPMKEPIAADVVAAPDVVVPKPLEPVAVVPVPTVEPVVDAGIPEKKNIKKKKVVPEAEPEIPSFCFESDWQSKLKKDLGKLEQAYLRQSTADKPVDQKPLDEHRKLLADIESASTQKKCGELWSKLRAWKKRNIR